MSIGDTIPCNTVDEALNRMDDLMKDGWDVEFEYKKGCKVILVLKGRYEE